METAVIFLKFLLSSLIRYFVIAGVPFLLFYKKFKNRFADQKIQEKAASQKQFLKEIQYSAQTSVILAMIGFLIFYSPLKKHTLIYDNFSQYSFGWFLASLILSFIIHDTYFYWVHRMMHHKNIFPLVHLVHHKSVNPSPWASYSFHLIEAIVEGLVLLMIVVLIPVHLFAIILFTIFSFMINVYGHLGYEIVPKRFRHSVWFKLLNTSVYHNLHHRHFKGNYGLYFRFWDKLMRTENPNYVQEFDRIQSKREKRHTRNSENSAQS